MQVQYAYTETGSVQKGAWTRTLCRNNPRKKENYNEVLREVCNSRLELPLAADAVKHDETEKRSPTLPRKREPHRRNGFVNLHKEYQRHPPIAVARGSGIIPELILFLQTWLLPSSKTRSMTRSACRRPST